MLTKMDDTGRLNSSIFVSSSFRLYVTGAGGSLGAGAHPAQVQGPGNASTDEKTG
jgi:hypothetical protein